MKTSNEKLKEVYQINLIDAKKGMSIAEKDNDKELLKRFERDAAIWKAKLENLK